MRGRLIQKIKTPKAAAVGLSVFFLAALCILALPSSGDKGNYIKYDTTRIVEYNFNEGSGSTTRDDSGRGKTGTLNGDTIGWTDEKDSNLIQDAAVRFNFNEYKRDDFIQVDDNPDFDISSEDVEGFVISAVIRVPADCAKRYLVICSKYDREEDEEHPDDREYDYSYGFTFYITEGNLRFTAYDGQCDINPNAVADIMDSDGVDLRDGQWHFVAVEYNYGVYRLFIDPDENSHGEVEILYKNVQPANTDTPFTIGRRLWSWDYNKDFYGDMDCLYFYEIEKAMAPNNPHRMWGKKNVGYWGFDEGSLEYEPIINDRVRWTSFNAGYHSYGRMLGTTIGFASRASAWKGEHCVSLGGGQPNFDRVQVFDPVNQLDFQAGIGEEDLYIEFLFNPDENIPADTPQPLVAKYDDTPNQNGYKVCLNRRSYDTRGYVEFTVANMGAALTVRSSYNIIRPQRWYHVWAWAQYGVLHLYIKDETSGNPWSEWTQSPAPGIGATNNDLFFGTELVNGGLYHSHFFEGLMDDVVIAHCFPE